MKVLGLMSGTSMDGLDCCLAEILISKKMEFDILDFKTYSYDNKIIKMISNNIGAINIDQIKSLDDTLGKIFSDIVADFLINRKIDLISSHGQTIIHQSAERSVQVGNPKYMHNRFKVPVLHNFREKDILLGGTGAPLIPYLDWLLFNINKKNTATLNIGGISNVTFIPSSGLRSDVLGFDVGPGMSLIDEYVKLEFNDLLDHNCKYSSKGKICYEMLEFLLKDEFVLSLPPKSTTREYFGLIYLKKIINKFSKLKNYDFLRTLVKFTAESIIYNINTYFKYNIDEIVISGGGAHHTLLVKDLNENLSNLCFMDKYKISIDNKESFLMAILGYTCYNKITNNMPSVTGASKYAVYGQIYE